MKLKLIIIPLVIVLNYHKVGIANWCNYSKDNNLLACNYDTKDECEAYRADDEVCIANPNSATPFGD